MSEFLIYQAFLRSQGHGISASYAEGPRLHETLWQDVVGSAVEFDRRMTRLERGDAKLGAVHWLAIPLMDDATRARLIRLWLDRNLISSLGEGSAVLHHVATELSQHDRAYLGATRGRELATPPLVSVIVPVYNKADFLCNCLDSILGQSLPSLEVLCIDDASTDGSSAVLARYAERDCRVRVISHAVNRGAGLSRNAGLAAANGQYVQFTDADDILPPQALELLLAKCQSDGVAVVRGALEGFHSESPDLGFLVSSVEERSTIKPLDDEVFWQPWWHTTYLFSRRFLQENGLGYPDLRSGEDPVFLAGVLAKAKAVSAISEVTYRYRVAPLEHKGRATFAHLSDYVRHLDLVKGILLVAKPEAWYHAYGPERFAEIQSMIAEWPLTAEQRVGAERRLSKIFELPSRCTQDRTRRRVLFVYHVCGLGGVEASILGKIAALRSIGYEAQAQFHGFWGEGGRSLTELPGIDVVETRAGQVRGLRAFRPDVVIVVDTAGYCDVVTAAGLTCPLVFETHMSDESAIDARIRAELLDPRYTAFVVPAEFNKELLARRGVDRRKIAVIPNPIDRGSFTPRDGMPLIARMGVPVDRTLVAFVGRLEPQKNVAEFVRIAKAVLMRLPSAHFILVGDAVDTASYAAAVRNSTDAVSNWFTFVDRLSREEMPLLYSALGTSGGCLLSTSLHESQPMTVLEAMACACPVVSSNVGGVHEIIEHRRTGYLYALGEVDAAADAVVTLARDQTLRAELIRAAMAYVNSTHSLHQAAVSYAGIFRRVAGPRPSAPQTPTPTPVGRHAAAQRRDALVRDFAAIHTALSARAPEPIYVATLRALFTEPGLPREQRTVTPYQDLVPGFSLGFEPGADVAVGVQQTPQPLSATGVHNSLEIAYGGGSRFFTAELEIPRRTVAHARHCQVSLYAKPSHALACDVVLRLSEAGHHSRDHRLCRLRLRPTDAVARWQGPCDTQTPGVFESDGPARLLLFFDAASGFVLRIGYIALEFA
jgi:glycosyltransferase involved in cell wall biosynthesis